MGFFKKKHGKSSVATSKLTADQKADIISMREDGYKPSEIAQDMGLSSDLISKVWELHKRKQDRTENAALDPVSAIKMEIEKLKLEQQKQEMQWKIEDRQADRQAELMEGTEEIMGNEENEEMQILKMILMGMMKGGGKQSSQPGLHTSHSNPGMAEPQPPPVLQAVGGSPSELELDEHEIEALIDQYPAQAKELQKLPDSVILKVLGMKFPHFSAGTRQKAMECLKKKKINVK